MYLTNLVNIYFGKNQVLVMPINDTIVPFATTRTTAPLPITPYSSTPALTSASSVTQPSRMFGRNYAANYPILLTLKYSGTLFAPLLTMTTRTTCSIQYMNIFMMKELRMSKVC